MTTDRIEQLEQDLVTARQDICTLARFIERREGAKPSLLQILANHATVDAGPRTRDQLGRKEVTV